MSNNGALPAAIDQRVGEAITLIGSVPGYESVAARLTDLRQRNRIRFVPTLQDRAHAGLTGTITLGPELFASGSTLLGLAETLVHEVYHFTQFPLEKTISFWSGVFTRTDPMRRYEKPAYASALAFLQAVATIYPERRREAEQEAEAVRLTFSGAYGDELEA